MYNLGSRWRECAQCCARILVNVGSADDLAGEVLCQACAGEAALPTILITLDGSVPRRVEFLGSDG